MPDIFLLKSRQAHDRAGKNRPYFFALKGFLLEISFLDLLAKCFTRVVPKGVYFEVVGTHVVFRGLLTS